MVGMAPSVVWGRLSLRKRLLWAVDLHLFSWLIFTGGLKTAQLGSGKSLLIP